jgi:hypothetical protein
MSDPTTGGQTTTGSDPSLTFRACSVDGPLEVTKPHFSSEKLAQANRYLITPYKAYLTVTARMSNAAPAACFHSAIL